MNGFGLKGGGPPGKACLVLFEGPQAASPKLQYHFQASAMYDQFLQ